MKTVFKVGMDVWDKTISPDKGKVIEVLKDTKFDFPIKVEFNDGLKIQYTNEGCFVKSKGAINTLSTVDYSIELEGFEQKGPAPTFEEAEKKLKYDRDKYAYFDLEGRNILYPKSVSPEVFEALRQLIILRDYYNKGWQPDWEDDKNKFCISVEKGKPCLEIWLNTSRVLAFKSHEIAYNFLEEQKELLEKAQPLL
jgi:hypothetical protein